LFLEFNYHHRRQAVEVAVVEAAVGGVIMDTRPAAAVGAVIMDNRPAAEAMMVEEYFAEAQGTRNHQAAVEVAGLHGEITHN
jgi:hypothetical protein